MSESDTPADKELRSDIEKARERAWKYRAEADSEEHREYWGGRYSAYTLILDMMEAR